MTSNPIVRLASLLKTPYLAFVVFFQSQSSWFFWICFAELMYFRKGISNLFFFKLRLFWFDIVKNNVFAIFQLLKNHYFTSFHTITEELDNVDLFTRDSKSIYWFLSRTLKVTFINIYISISLYDIRKSYRYKNQKIYK